MKKYGLIGKSLAHSFSKSFFTDFFARNEIDATYGNIEIADIKNVRTIIQEYDGCNVTIPYKEVIIPYLDELDVTAEEIGAVNTIKRINDKWVGYNTDVWGFRQSIKPFLTNQHERALLIGNGGAAKAVGYVLRKIGLKVFFATRNPNEKNTFSFEEINDNMIRSCKVIVNCTPVGMYPNTEEVIEIPFECLSDQHLVIDLIYNPPKTVFLANAQKYGATILNGESMLKEQALKAYKIWTE